MQQNLGGAIYCLALNGEYSFLSSVASKQLLKEKTIDGLTNMVIFIGGHHVSPAPFLTKNGSDKLTDIKFEYTLAYF